MTYEQAVQWIVDNMHLGMFKNFKDLWENGIEQDPSFSPKLLQHPRFRQILIDAVFDKKPKWKYLELPGWMYRGAAPRFPKRVNTFNTIKYFKEEFTTKDVYERNTFRPKPSIRRELQELVKEGKLSRIRKGTYKVLHA